MFTRHTPNRWWMSTCKYRYAQAILWWQIQSTSLSFFSLQFCRPKWFMHCIYMCVCKNNVYKCYFYAFIYVFINFYICSFFSFHMCNFISSLLCWGFHLWSHKSWILLSRNLNVADWMKICWDMERLRVNKSSVRTCHLSLKHFSHYLPHWANHSYAVTVCCRSSTVMSRDLPLLTVLHLQCCILSAAQSMLEDFNPAGELQVEAAQVSKGQCKNTCMASISLSLARIEYEYIDSS